MKKRHTHKYPNFLLKNWNKDPYSKFVKRKVKYDRKRHMGEKGYYPNALEDKLSVVETIMSSITKKLFRGHVLKSV